MCIRDRLFAAGLSWKYIIGAFAALAAAAAVVFAFFSDKIGKGYQWYRILAVIDPNNETGWAPSETIWKNICLLYTSLCTAWTLLSAG